MTNNQIMKKHLESKVFQPLRDQGFIGKYPHFRREKENCIELIVFQTNKYGGSFAVGVSAVFPNSENKNFVFYDGLTIDDLTVWNTYNRYRLKGMYGGWFYYRDLYSKYIFGFGKIIWLSARKMAIRPFRKAISLSNGLTMMLRIKSATKSISNLSGRFSGCKGSKNAMCEQDLLSAIPFKPILPSPPSNYAGNCQKTCKTPLTFSP